MTPEEKKKRAEASIEADMLNKLSSIARGVNMFGEFVSQTEMLNAQEQYHRLKLSIDSRKIEREKIEAQLQIEAARLTHQAEIEHRKLDIEEERVRLQKAELVVKALELAVNAGAEPMALLSAIDGLKQTLLPETTSRLLTERK